MPREPTTVRPPRAASAFGVPEADPTSSRTTEPFLGRLPAMDVQAVSALLAALLILAIGTSALLRSRRDKMYTSFAAFTFTVSAWHLCTFIDAATDSPVMRWLALWAAATIPVTAIRFFRIFLAQP